MLSAIVSSRKNSDELALGKSLETIHDALMGSNDHAKVILLKEICDSVRSKLHDISCSLGISEAIGEDSEIIVSVSGVRPKDIKHKLGLLVLNLVHDLEWSFYGFNVGYASNSSPDSAVQAQYLVLDNGCQWHPLEKLVHPPEYAVVLESVLIQLLRTFIRETECAINLDILVVSSDQVDLLRVHAFQSQ